MIMNSENIASQSFVGEQTSDANQSKPDVKGEILSNVRSSLQSALVEAQQSGNTKAVEKLQIAIAKIDQRIDASTQGSTVAAPAIIQAPLPPGVRIVVEPSGKITYGPSITTPPNNDIPPQAVEMMQGLCVTLVLCVVGLPIARAFARWIDRRGSTPPASREVSSRLEAIEQAVESVAVEVERISEGQRFTTKLLNERAQEPAREYVAAEREPLSSLPSNSRRS